jgi:hypothetical protein
MANKRKPAKKHSSNQILALPGPDEVEALLIARTVLRPTVQAAATLKAYDKSYGDIDLKGLVDALAEQTKYSNGGDLSRAEAMLTAQAHTLDAIFNNLASKAIKAEYMGILDTYLKLALRAQSQCRSTWEALAAIKNPPFMGYVQQANIAHGPQQVNNSPPDETSRTRENENQQNKLMEQKNDEWVDTGTKGAAGRADTAMATVGEVDRTEDQDR